MVEGGKCCTGLKRGKRWAVCGVSCAFWGQNRGCRETGCQGHCILECGEFLKVGSKAAVEGSRVEANVAEFLNVNEMVTDISRN